MTRHLAALLWVVLAAPAFASSTEYADACQELIGDIPDFSCADGEAVPVTVNGQIPDNYTKDMTCDRPALLNNGSASDGQCVPYSRILDLSDETRQISVMCRQKKIRAPDSMEFDEIDVIAHNPETGATCWFQKTESSGTPINGEFVISPTSDPDFYNPPEEVVADGCGNCHDNDPFMYSPFVGQVWGNVPVNPFGPYYHVNTAGLGFDTWPVTQIQPRDNTCIGCHRIGIDQTCGQLADWATGQSTPPGANKLGSSYPLSNSMPPYHGLTLNSWNVINTPAVDTLASCCTDPTQTICNASPIRRAQ